MHEVPRKQGRELYGGLPVSMATEFNEQPYICLHKVVNLSWFKGNITDASFSGTPPTYGYDADRAEEQRRHHHDMMPYIDDSPSSSPHLSSKSRGSRDTLSSGSLESSKSVLWEDISQVSKSYPALKDTHRRAALQSEPDLEKGLEMRKWVLSGILASEETYLSHLEALLLSEPDLEKGLEMRKWVLSGILASEETYLSHLEALLLPMKPLKAAATTSQPVLTVQQVETIFFKVPELYEIHKEFYDGLLPRVQQWSHHQRVGDLFQKLFTMKAAATTSQPVLTVQQVETIFFKVPELYEIHKEFYDGLLPRVQQWSHHQRVGDLFQKLASQLGVYRAFVDNYEVAVETADKCCQANTQFSEISENRQLLKDRFMVELVEGARKLRHVFLFTDLLLCTKLKKQVGGKSQQYDCKWYIPLSDLTFQMIDESDCSPNIPQVPDEEIDAMKIKISQIKNEIQREKRANKGSKVIERLKKKLSEQESLLLLMSPNMAFKVHNRNGKRANKGSKVIERLKKKLSEQESLLLLMSPNMAFKVHNRNGKSYMFLISSDYERAEWREMIREQQKKCFKSFSLTSVELQMLTNSCVKLQTVHNIPLTINKEDDESPGLYGFLNVIVHSASGLKQSLNLYCTLEVDSFGYFVNKAKTRVYRDTTEPNWNEEFEIELEGSQTLRLLCYEKCYNKTRLNKEDGESTDRIMGKGQIQLDPQALQDKDWQRTVISMNGCVEEIERRGMEEVGIYRVSGVATDIQALKAAFDANNKDVSVMMSEMDVNAIAGTLKLYFRELPEPLFTDDLYPNFAGGIALSDSVAKESCMLNLLLSLPEPNLVTFLFLLDHLKRVAENEIINKMSLHNLATVFGPTLLRPSEKDSKIPANPTQPITMSDSWSLEVMSQVQVLLYFLQLETIPTPDSKRQSILFSTEV
ncbi:UNVERIFIED_CONTAM: hypothetical protein FKN15_047059 [Acipenser sinensis]